MKIDDIDRKLLREIQRDSSLALETLGARVGLSRNACWRRVKALESNGVIDKRVALLNPAAVGRPLTVFILVRAARHDKDWADKFKKALLPMEDVQGVYRMTGELDYLIRAQVADVADYDRLYQTLIERIDMAELSASFVMEPIKDTTALPL